jgi:hypothetical protein
MQVVHDGPVFVEYGQAALAGEWGPAELDEMFAGQVQGLCGTAVPGLVAGERAPAREGIRSLIW